MDEPALDPVQQAVIEARRKQILDAATNIFASKGFARATIRDVAKQAGIADGTIYNYFANKEALMLALFNRLNATDQRTSDFERAQTVDVATFMRDYLRQRLETVSADGLQLFQVVLAEVLANPALREQYFSTIMLPTLALSEHYFGKLVADGAIQHGDAQLTPRMLAATTLGLLVLRLLGDQTLIKRWDEIPDLLANTLLNGLQPMVNSKQ